MFCKMQKSVLNPKQVRAVTHILESNSVEKAAKKAGVSRSTIYNWMRDPGFKEQLERERRAVFEEGLNALKMAAAKAARTQIITPVTRCRNHSATAVLKY